jgi:ribosomal protein S18 acetylase RimI-like enzyme
MKIIKQEKVTKKIGDFIDSIFSDSSRKNDIEFVYDRVCFIVCDNAIENTDKAIGNETENTDKTISNETGNTDNGKIIGAITLQKLFNEIYLDEIVIIPEYRGKGVGSWILSEIEKYYKNDGYEFISLVTYHFQAPEFYIKNGFTLEFVRESKQNPNLTKYFFVKKIN